MYHTIMHLCNCVLCLSCSLFLCMQLLVVVLDKQAVQLCEGGAQRW
jgi:hypothetical protein